MHLMFTDCRSGVKVQDFAVALLCLDAGFGPKAFKFRSVNKKLKCLGNLQ